MPHRRLRRALTTGLGASALGVGLVFTGAGAASAHVTADPSSTAADSYTVMTVSVPHGCEGKATTKIKIGLPDELAGVTPTVNPNWNVKQVHKDGDAKKDVTEIDYTAKKPLPDDLRDTFELSFYIPPETEGKTLNFPTTQECTSGETKWDQTPKKGQSEEDLETPAPSFKVTAPAAGSESDAGTDSSAEATAPSDSAEQASAPAGSSSAALTWGIIGTILGALGLTAGGAAFVRSRKSA